MEVAISSARAPGTFPASDELTAQQLVEIYRLMFLSRAVDDREILLKRQQKIFFQISAAGHEALQVGAALALRPGYDWFFPYYRDRALCLALGVTPYDMMLQAVGAATDPASGGRQMPTHWSSRPLHIVSTSSSTATQLLHAVGCAEAGRAFQPPSGGRRQSGRRLSRLSRRGVPRGRSGAGLRGRGLDLAGRVLGGDEHRVESETAGDLLVEDNGYAISVPVEVNTPGGNISRLVANFPNFYFAEMDGNDPVACLRAFQEAAAHCRAGRGPALVHGHCVRLYSHSLSDDDKIYRSRRRARGRRAVRSHRANADAADRRGHSDGRGDRRAGTADWSAKPPRPPSARWKRRCRRSRASPQHVYSEDLDPTQRRVCHRAAADSQSRTAQPEPGKRRPAPRTMADLINVCLRDEMRRDPRIVVYGEDVADASRSEALAEVKGKGGVFKLTAGLANRVWIGAGVQLAAGRGQHCWPRRWLRVARHEAGGRNSIL